MAMRDIKDEKDVLQEARVSLGLTQQQVADKAKINLRLYQKFESGERKLASSSFWTAHSVLDALELDLTTFVRGGYAMRENQNDDYLNSDTFQQLDDQYTTAFFLLHRVENNQTIIKGNYNGTEIENKKFVIPDPTERRCRFCGKTEPEATFKKKAHAVPECLGNKGIISLAECDVCNDRFSILESNLSQYIMPMNTLMHIQGKRGIPKIKSKDKLSQVMVDDGITMIEQREDGQKIAEIGEGENELNLVLPQQGYIPSEVFKVFSKMAISLMPYSLLTNFRATIKWLNDETPSSIITPAPVIERFVPGPRPFVDLTFMGLCRKDDSLPVPYFQLLVCYGNMIFQVIIPSEKDMSINGQQVNLIIIPTPYEQGWAYGKIQTAMKDFSSTEKVTDGVMPVTMKSDSVVKIIEDGKVVGSQN